ncbi:MAG: hypothetical protein QOE31_2043 [Solirubrobacteraceae bacterium]|jgi:hypothetical protein|nr:hypothetical protein [Solirubrobacteraceae bacterium]
MRRLLAVALPAVLLLCSPAAAKEVSSAKVCGDDGCRSIAGADDSLLQGGPPTDGPARSEPFVRMEFRVAEGPGQSQSVRNIFLPRSGLILADDGVTWMRPIALAQLRQQARRVTPLPVSVFPATAPLARPAAAPTASLQQPAASTGTGVRAWWLAVPAVVLVLAAGAALARRRPRGGRATPAGVSR